ncbi:NnrU family protein [Proteobacteria bacterium 005FR1]|nr:NnrU family protein [Proteobacteria bacterium 005FR1]
MTQNQHRTSLETGDCRLATFLLGQTMNLLVIGLIIFIGTHAIPTFTGLRSSLATRLGEKRYKGLFSLVALVGLVLIIIGKARAEFVFVYDPPSWGRHLTMLLVLIAFILLPAAHMPTNIKRFTRHPMLWGVTLWGVGHLLANGDLASVILFGSFALYSPLAMLSANHRGAKLQEQRVPLRKDLMVVVAGFVVYAVFLFAHPYLFGRAIM